VPIPWEGQRPPFGFTTAERAWLPMPERWADLTVEVQLERLDSMLSLYRMAIELRSARPEFGGSVLDWYGSPAGCLAFRRPGGLVCALNASDEPIPLPPGEVLLTSAPIEGGMLPVNAAAWLV
jgi:alpha-glucosidase